MCANVFQEGIRIGQYLEDEPGSVMYAREAVCAVFPPGQQLGQTGCSPAVLQLSRTPTAFQEGPLGVPLHSARRICW